MNRLIKIPFPILISGEGKLSAIGITLNQHFATKTLIVSDKTLTELGFCTQVSSVIQEHGIESVLYDQITPDPTISIVESGVKVYQSENCDSVVALGGGSVIDCAKAITACAAKNKPIASLAGLFRIRKKLPTFIAVPTTAGTGSEATVVAVISDPDKKQKFTVIDPCLVPHYAIIDPLMMLGLPAKITAETGLDALTHAIESYIGLHSTNLTKAYSIDAIQRIFNNLPLAYQDGSNINARTEMSLASYHAGIAFTRTSVGYVHAIAHQLGAYYHIPHGLANAVLLPHILDFSFESTVNSYAELAYETKLAEQNVKTLTAANMFVKKVKSLITELDIPCGFEHLLNEDIPQLAKRAVREAYCDYPVPKLMTEEECKNILTKLLVD